MDDLIKEFNKKIEDFQYYMDKYPLLHKDIHFIYEKKIKEIEDLVDKNDEYYIKKAIKEIDNLNDFIKDRSTKTNDIFKEFEKLSDEWESIQIKDNIEKTIINKLNNNMKKSYELIKSEDFEDIVKAIELFRKTIKELKDYEK